MITIYLILAGKLTVQTLLLFSASAVVAGDYFAKLWSTNQRTVFLLAAFLGYFLSSVFYIPTLLREGLVVTSVIWSLLSIIGFLFVGLVIFREQLTTLQIIGVIFGIIALAILSVE